MAQLQVHGNVMLFVKVATCCIAMLFFRKVLRMTQLVVVTDILVGIKIHQSCCRHFACIDWNSSDATNEIAADINCSVLLLILIATNDIAITMKQLGIATNGIATNGMTRNCC